MSISVQQLLVQYLHYLSDRFGSSVYEPGSTPAFHNALAFHYWFGLIGFDKDRRTSFTSHTVYSTWLACLHTQSESISVQQLLVQYLHYLSDRFGSSVYEPGSTPAFHNALAFKYWFGLINFAMGEKPLLQVVTAKTRQDIAFFFFGFD
jgi:hypothetical protein